MSKVLKSKRWKLDIGLDETVEVVRMAGVHPQFQFKVVHFEHDARKPDIMHERKIGHAPTIARAFKMARDHVQRVRGW
jgi:hypothetical protein